MFIPFTAGEDLKFLIIELNRIFTMLEDRLDEIENLRG